MRTPTLRDVAPTKWTPNRQPVFHSPDDRRLYLDLLGHHAARFRARLLGYCLMTNHIHLVAMPEREDSLARALGRVHSEHALRDGTKKQGADAVLHPFEFFAGRDDSAVTLAPEGRQIAGSGE